MSVEQNKTLMRRFVEEFWNNRQFTVADEMFAPEAVSPVEIHLPPGPAGIRRKAETLLTGFPDLKYSVEFMVADGNRVSAFVNATGTHQGKYLSFAPTGKRLSWSEIFAFQESDGKVVSSWTQSQMLPALSQLMPSPAEIIDLYYKYANAGDWSAWCDLFAEDMVMDEQLAGHIEGLATLRPMMDGMGKMYSKFQNVPVRVITSGNEGAVVSHISAASPSGDAIEAEVMNYFRFANGRIVYMSNFHDSAPFKPVLGGGPADNTQLVFRMYDCFGKGDMETIKNELFHPEIVWKMPGHHPLSGEIRGVDGVIAFFSALFKAGITVDNTHFGVLDDGTVVEKHLGHGEVNGKKFLFPTCTTYGIRDGKIADVQVHAGDQHSVDRYMWAQFKLKKIPARLNA
jgi:ketosteroid isomerase-like protein